MIYMTHFQHIKIVRANRQLLNWPPRKRFIIYVLLWKFETSGFADKSMRLHKYDGEYLEKA